MAPLSKQDFYSEVRVRVMIPFFDEVALIRRAVQSVRANSGAFNNVDIIICNDGKIDLRTIRDAIGEKLMTGNNYSKH